MKRIQLKVPRATKGKPHYAYLVNDKEIAACAGVSVAAVVVARLRGNIKTFSDLVNFIVQRKLASIWKRKGAQRCRNSK